MLCRCLAVDAFDSYGQIMAKSVDSVLERMSLQFDIMTDLHLCKWRRIVILGRLQRNLPAASYMLT
jgi:hypothetical protein